MARPIAPSSSWHPNMHLYVSKHALEGVITFFENCYSRGTIFIKKQCSSWGTWVAQLVKWPTLGFSSGHDLVVHEIEFCIGLCADGTKPAWDSLSPSLTTPPPPPLVSVCTHTLSLSKIKLKKKKEWLFVFESTQRWDILSLVEERTQKGCSAQFESFPDESQYQNAQAHYSGLKSKGRATSLQVAEQKGALPWSHLFSQAHSF